MLIITLVKGVPARTTRVVTMGGILKREEMDIVLNPHDLKALEASDFIKRNAGGKVIALTMGPDQKLAPILKNLYNNEVNGIDESVILSDRRMAGADTWATSYTLSLGIKKIVEEHLNAIDRVIDLVKKYGPSDFTRAGVRSIYYDNMLPNEVYSELGTVRETIISRFLDGSLSTQETLKKLEEQKEKLRKFVVIAGIKTTDGETGSVGPQVAEALSQETGIEIPHATYVEKIDIDDSFSKITIERKLGNLVQVEELDLPCLITIDDTYVSGEKSSYFKKVARLNNFRTKRYEPIKWNADEIKADQSKIGLAGSPTIVGPGIDIGKPPTQKVINKTKVFVKKVEKITVNGSTLGPFDQGDTADSLPEEVQIKLEQEGLVKEFTIDMLIEEIAR